MASVMTYDWVLQQGDSVAMAFATKNWADPAHQEQGDPMVNAYNYTGAVVRMQAREQYSSSAAALSVSSTGTGDDYIDVNNATNTITIYISPETMARVKAGDYVYDVECTFADGTVKKLLKGSISVEPEVTK